MNEQIEDVTEFRPAGFERPAVADDPNVPGVRLSELRRGPLRNPIQAVPAPAWLKWSLIGLLIVIGIPGLIWALGILGAMIGLLAGILAVLVAMLVKSRSSASH